MKKTTKVKSLRTGSPFGENNDIYPVDISFENGDHGVAYAKSDPPPYKAGDEVEIEDYGNDRDGQVKYRVKKVYKGGGGYSGGGGRKGGFKADPVGQMVGNAITNASLLVAHSIVPHKDLGNEALRICKLSVWLKNKFSQEESPGSAQGTLRDSHGNEVPHEKVEPSEPAQAQKPEPAPVDELDEDSIPF